MNKRSIIPTLLATIVATQNEISGTHLNSRDNSLLKITRYDGNNVKQARSWNEPIDATPPGTVAMAIRAAYLSTIFAPLVITSLPALFFEPFRRHVWYPLVAWTMARGGAAWIKWAQWASTRPDMIPEALCAKLAELQTNAPVHSFFQTRREIESSFGLPLETLFSSFNPKPLASGSIAQVYKATYEGIQ
jgi:hypothetical protein